MRGVWYDARRDSTLGRNSEFGAFLSTSLHGSQDWRNVGPGGGFRLAGGQIPTNHVTPQPIRVVMEGPNSPARQDRVKLADPRGGMWRGRG